MQLMLQLQAAQATSDAALSLAERLAPSRNQPGGDVYAKNFQIGADDARRRRCDRDMRDRPGYHDGYESVAAPFRAKLQDVMRWGARHGCNYDECSAAVDRYRQGPDLWDRRGLSALYLSLAPEIR